MKACSKQAGDISAARPNASRKEVDSAQGAISTWAPG